MTDTKESTTTSEPGGPSSSAIAEAIERRLRQREQTHGTTQANPTIYAPFDEHHEKRQEFRRLVDPNILRPNPRPIALEALNILCQLADNILKDSEDPKFHRFKPTNPKIKKYLVDSKGTIELARALGFEPEVDNFQPFYVFKKRKMMDLRIGSSVIKEILQQENLKEEQTARARAMEKAAAEAAVAKVKLAFMDDRKSTANRDQREKELRAARGGKKSAISPRSTDSGRQSREDSEMPGTGQTLSGVIPESNKSKEADTDDESEEGSEDKADE